jgi:phage terminase large subunit-like protein
MTVIEAGFADGVRHAVGDWHPTRYTPELRPGQLVTDGDRLLRFAERYWTLADAEVFELDEWQRWLIRRVLERYPDDWHVPHLRGQLRYRQAVISMGRQNGKSVLGALLAIYLLALHVRGPRVIGLASVDEQAQIVYQRVKYAIDNSEQLSRELTTSDTRGIKRKSPNGRAIAGTYNTLPAKEDSAQGHPASGVLYDELHLGLAALWDAMLLAQRAIRNALMVGLTTAGDDSSELLLRLYDEGEAAIAGDDERFGFFLWEAPSDELTEAGVIAANPAIACGRVDFDTAWNDARKMHADLRRGKDGLTGRQRVIRYTLNRFLKGAAAAWASVEKWQAGGRQPEIGSEVVFAIERTPSWEHVAITATCKRGDELHTELVASIGEPTPDQLAAVCSRLAGNRTATFAMPASTLGALGKRLRADGFEVWLLGATEEASAAQTAHGAIERGAVVHAHDELVQLQFTRGRRREQEAGGWRVSRSKSTGEIDAVISTIVGLYVASVKADRAMQLG